MIKEKTALVTGASRGLGEAIAKRLASEGANIAAVYAGNADKAQAVCDFCQENYGVKARAYQCDVADFAAAKELVSRVREDFEGFQILVNNAGITRDGLILCMKEEDFDAVVDTNLKGAFNMIRHASGLFLRQREGAIVNVSSVTGLMGNPGQANYAASKAGLIGLTKTVAKELAAKGIRCNAVAPGFIATDMTRDQKENPMVQMIPMGRMGRPQDVADAVFYLLNAPYVTGEVLRVDGGIGM